jgi:hypothetical protein
LRAAAWLCFAIQPLGVALASFWTRPGVSPFEKIGDFVWHLTYLLDWTLLGVFVVWGLPKLSPVATSHKVLHWIGGFAIVCGAYALYGHARRLPNSLAGFVYQVRQPSWWVIIDVAVVLHTAAGACCLLGGIGLLRRGGRRSSALLTVACTLSLAGMACDVTEMTVSVFRRHDAWPLAVAEVTSPIQWSMYGLIFAILAIPLLAHSSVRSSFTPTAGRGFTPILNVQDSNTGAMLA